MTKKIDCRGLVCPHPVINTKNALNELPGGETLAVIVDNPISCENVTLFAKNAGHKVEVQESNEEFILKITKKESQAEAKEKTEKSSKITYLITSNLFGQGSPDLGQVLIKSLFVSLSEQPDPPGSLIFLNSGVYLTIQGSLIIEQLKKLVDKGTTIFSCGTCLDYYRLKEKLEVGVLCNMYEIIKNLSQAERVITIA